MDTFPAEAKEYAKEVELPAHKVRGWVHEVEVPMRKGESFRYETSHEGAGGRVWFNVHSHHGRETTYHAEGTEARIAGTFTAPEEGKFYLMWENKSDAPVAVRMRAVRA